MATDPFFVGQFRPEMARMIAVDGLRPVKVCEGSPSGKGSRLMQLTAVSTDTAANTLRLFHGKRRTQGANMGTITFTTTSIARSVGSFLADGWKVGMEVVLVGTKGADGAATPLDVVSVITAISATTLTITGATAGSVTGAPATLVDLFEAVQLSLSNLAANQGNLASNGALDLLSDSKPFVDYAPGRFMMLPPACALFMQVTTALTTVETIETYALLGDFD